MAPRVSSELLLVGSLPADSVDSALRSAAGFFGDLVFALPDGETGPRAAWVGYDRERLVRPTPGVVVVQETESPTGIPRHAYETPVFGIRPGLTELRWDSWPRIDDAIAGYQVFSALRTEGVIPAQLRFQVGLPFPSSALRLLVRMANFAVANSGRTVDWLHLAGPRYLRSEDRGFFRRLADLEPGDARVFLGIVLPIDGVAGLRRRHATASRYISSFGVAMYCGFGRQPGADGAETMREHARVVRTVP
jgi:hypothetical protein